MPNGPQRSLGTSLPPVPFKAIFPRSRRERGTARLHVGNCGLVSFPAQSGQNAAGVASDRLEGLLAQLATVEAGASVAK